MRVTRTNIINPASALCSH